MSIVRPFNPLVRSFFQFSSFFGRSLFLELYPLQGFIEQLARPEAYPALKDVAAGQGTAVFGTFAVQGQVVRAELAQQNGLACYQLFGDGDQQSFDGGDHIDGAEAGHLADAGDKLPQVGLALGLHARVILGRGVWVGGVFASNGFVFCRHWYFP